MIFPSVEALREPALNTLVLFPPNNLCNFGVSSVFFVVHDFGLKEKFLERQIFLIRIFLIWQNPIVFPLLEFSLQSFGHKTELFPIGGSVVQVTCYLCISVIIFGQALMVDPKTGEIVANADFRKGGGVAGF